MSAALALATVVELHAGPRESGSYDPERPATPTAEQYAGFDAAFSHFNSELFDGKLPHAMLTLAKSGKSFGYYISKRWRGRDEKEGRLGEIALSPEHLGRGEREAAGTLVHEMVHHWQHVAGKPSRRGYHNVEWGTKMEALGLMPSKTGEPGGKRVGQQMTHYIVENGAFARAFEKLHRGVLLPFIAGSSSIKEKPGPRKLDASKSRFTCPSCGDIARGKPSLEIQCIKCGVPFTVDAPPSPVEVGGA